MRVVTFIFLICLLFSIPVSAQSEASRIFFKQGLQKAEIRDYETALSLFTRSLKFADSENFNESRTFLSQIHYNLGVCYYQLNQQLKATEEFAIAIDLSNKKYQKAYYALGMAEAELKNWEKAQTAFYQSIRLNQQDGEAWFDLAMVFIAQKDYENAQKSFWQSVKYNSVSKSAGYNNIGVISALMGNFQSAEKEFKLALFESDGKLIVAESNLRFCRLYTKSNGANLLSTLKFSNKNKSEN